MSIVVIGSVTWDVAAFASRLPKAGETLLGRGYQTGLGGKGANQAAAAAKLGASARFFGRVGRDDFGDAVRAGLTEFGVDPSDLAEDDAATALGVILIGASGENAIIQAPGANRAVSGADVTRAADAIAASKAVLLQLEVPLETSLAAAMAARKAGALSIMDPAPAPQDGLAGSVFMAFDIVTPNEVETETYAGFRPTDAESGLVAARRLVELGADTAIVTLGAAGAAWARETGDEGFQPAFEVTAIDTVGAGDCFNGALAVALTEGQALAYAIRFASAAAALSTTAVGAAASSPSREQVARLLGG
jgi:ribokinase